MESYGVCVSAREIDAKAGIPAFLYLLLSHKVHKTPSYSHVSQSVPASTPPITHVTVNRLLS